VVPEKHHPDGALSQQGSAVGRHQGPAGTNTDTNTHGKSLLTNARTSADALSDQIGR
jgi:hypothetical protein